jgi:hypothetical protein
VAMSMMNLVLLDSDRGLRPQPPGREGVSH